MAIDLDKDAITKLKEDGFNLYKGTYGYRYETEKNATVECFPNHKLQLLHEMEIAIVDLSTHSTGPQTIHVGKSQQAEREALISPYGQNYFDPTFLAAKSHQDSLQSVLDSGGVVIVFASPKREEKYYTATYENDSRERESSFEICNYEFINENIYINECLFGKEVYPDEKADRNREMASSISAGCNDISYECTFYLGDQDISLFKNKAGKTVGFLRVKDVKGKLCLMFVLPQFSDKYRVLKNLFTNVIPDLNPDLFPDFAKNNWMNDDEYLFPEEKALLSEKALVEMEYKDKLAGYEKQVGDVRRKYAFLSNILSVEGFDDYLVDNVETTLNYIGYENVVNMDTDKERKGNKREDLQIREKDRLSIIEVKGLKSIPSENDCREVQKYVTRALRSEDRPPIVHGIFIANHKRILPPLERDNPAFTQPQIEDALGERYTLVSTWELFQATRLLQEGILSFNDIDLALHTPGLFRAIPPSATSIGKIEALYQDTVACVILAAEHINKGDELIIKSGNEYFKQTVNEMRVDDKPVKTAQRGDKVSIKMNQPIRKSAQIYLK
ncbi:MAG: hypothetical protein RIN56_01145 [Sporomusaceae bacterium]|nr:hypothetical protein [Sporomusaceae bacterium]